MAYWPLGLLEHHGWHLPVGFDGIKADRICQRLAARTGGELVDLAALTPGSSAATAWPFGGPPPDDGRHPGVECDPGHRLFSQLGADPRGASARHGEEGLRRLEEALAARILGFLAG